VGNVGFVFGVAGNIAANLIFWLLLGGLFWGISRATGRRFYRFFGLVNIESVGVYVSNLWTPEASPSGRTIGYTISLHELRAAQSVEKIFGTAPLSLPDLVRGLVDALWLRQQVGCEIDVSPLKVDEANLERNLIVVGSSARNSVRAHYIATGLPSTTLKGEKPSWHSTGVNAVTIERNGTKSEVSFPDVNIAVVEKCRDPGRGTVVFFCFGIRGDSTWAATEYLIRNWKRLVAEFGDQDFVVCLGFPKTERYLDEYKEPLRLSMGRV
jgi:hypothetical protein